MANPNQTREAILLALLSSPEYIVQIEKMLHILVGTFTPASELRMKIRICKVEMNEIGLKYRSKEKLKDKEFI
ncbi:hypothetical protein [Arthrobacter sp. H16F315]|uniref:hypothetical protein n=1 Tax=Arthrobacter sp. H16F315 TaxID=2955314 RepID=UPI002096F0CE|nr:hypothetical protein [Arthrobacter sp. H16F315]MDD1478107.1 hypothetical protein [Arthrobacter sp. H16F315]